MSILRRSNRQPEGLIVAAAADAELEPHPDVERWAALARGVLEAEGVAKPAELNLLFVTPGEITELNQRWMGVDGPTDVLSFPIDAESSVALPGVPELLGDVVICPDVAYAQAASTGRAIDDELALLVVHGVLHVVGFDHADPGDEARMHAREDTHLRRLHDPAWIRSTT